MKETNIWGIGTSQSSKAYVNNGLDNRTIYYDQIDHSWCLCNENYHQMVSILVNIVKNVSSLCGDATKWHLPEKRIGLDMQTREMENEYRAMRECESKCKIIELNDDLN